MLHFLCPLLDLAHSSICPPLPCYAFHSSLVPPVWYSLVLWLFLWIQCWGGGIGLLTCTACSWVISNLFCGMLVTSCTGKMAAVSELVSARIAVSEIAGIGCIGMQEPRIGISRNMFHWISYSRIKNPHWSWSSWDKMWLSKAIGSQCKF